MKFHGALYCITRVQNCHLKANMLSGAFTVFHIKREGAPSGVKHTQRGQKVPSHFEVFYMFLPPLPSLLSLFFCSAVCLPLLYPPSLSFPSWQLAMLSFCVSLCADNSRSDLSWTALESGGSCLLLY